MKKSLLLAIGLMMLTASYPVVAAEKNVTVYAARFTDAEKQLYAEFQEKTGITVTVVSGKAKELMDRMGQEGADTQADLFAVVDGGILQRAKQNGLTQAIPAGAVTGNIPASLRDKENHWVSLSTRARVIVYSKERVTEKDLSTYEALADPKWKGKIVMRPGSALYNQSFLASMVALDGPEKTAAFVEGLVANFARPPKGGDRGQAQDIAAGVADLTLMNTYYIGRMLASTKPEEVETAKKVGVFFPNQKTTGTHINVNGIALVRNAKNRDNAVKLLEFLTGAEAQERLATTTYEFPANPKAKKPALLESWGAFTVQAIDFAVLDANAKAAASIAAENGWE